MADLRPCDIELMALLVQRRLDMRRILGSKYAERSRDYQAFLPAIHERMKGKNLLDSVIKQADEMDRAGHDPNMLFCAYLDNTEARNGD